MSSKISAGHQGAPTEDSLVAHLNDPSNLLQCGECGAWVRFDGKEASHLLLEVHVDRRPKTPQNRILKPYRRYGHTLRDRGNIATLPAF